MDQRDAAALPRRLRALRRGRRLTQQAVASALKVGVSSVSSWESTTSLKPPPPARLDEYAVLFAGAEDPPRLVPDAELTSAQRAERDRLAAELERLRLDAVGESDEADELHPRSLWHFPDGGQVRVICGRVSAPPGIAKASNHNYMQLSAYADLDALMELYGQLRAENPTSDIAYDLATRLEPDDLRSHLVLLGSGHMNPATPRAVGLLPELPVRQVADPEVADGEVFELTADPTTRFLPTFVTNDPTSEPANGPASTATGVTNEVTEDVGWFFRTFNPYNVDRTLTICSGVFTRGVYGAVRFLTDRVLRESNQQVLADHFGDLTTFGVLMRVSVNQHATATPDLRNPGSIRYTWPIDRA